MPTGHYYGASLSIQRTRGAFGEHSGWVVGGERGVCNGDVTLAPGKRGGHVDAHVQQLSCTEVLQRRSPKGGLEKSRFGRESEDGAAQGNRVLSKWR